MYIYIYSYIYRERERERERLIYIYIYIIVGSRVLSVETCTCIGIKKEKKRRRDEEGGSKRAGSLSFIRLYSSHPVLCGVLGASLPSAPYIIHGHGTTRRRAGREGERATRRAEWSIEPHLSPATYRERDITKKLRAAEPHCHTYLTLSNTRAPPP